MANGFPNIIKQALDAVHYSGPKDNERFRAAVQDLSADFPEERKIFLRNADDRFLQICGTAMDCGRDQLQVKSKQASEYLINEYWMGDPLSKDFAAKVVTGFRLYAKGSEEETGEKPQTAAPAGRSSQGVRQVNPPQPKAAAQKPPRPVQTSQPQQPPRPVQTQQPRQTPQTVQGTPGSTSGNKSKLIIGILALLGITLFFGITAAYWEMIGSPEATDTATETTEAITETTETAAETTEVTNDAPYSIYSSSYDVYLDNIGDTDTIEVDNSGEDIDYDYNLSYDDDIIDAAWEDIDDPDNFNVVIKRLAKGETKLEIYASETDSDVKIDKINPAVVTVH